MDENVPRWIYASLSDYFKTISDGIPLQFFVEGVDEDESEDYHNDNATFRINGPFANRGSSVTIWSLEAQILLTDLMNTTSDNAYSMYTWAGVFAEAMDTAIPIYRYGTGVEDDDSLVGCLERDPRAKESVRINNYGQVDITARVKQASVNGRFILCT